MTRAICKRQTWQRVDQIPRAALNVCAGTSLRTRHDTNALQQTEFVRVPERAQRTGNMTRILMHRTSALDTAISTTTKRRYSGLDNELLRSEFHSYANDDASIENCRVI